MTEPASTASAAPERLTVVVAGHRPDRLAEQAVPAVAAALSTVLAAITAAAAPACAPVVLTGIAAGSDTLTAEAAATLGLPLELLAPGCPEPLSAAQQRAGNTVWLGAPDPLADGEEAVAIRDEIALGFADMLVVVWDGEAPHGLGGGTVRLAVKAALMMVPTVWVDLTGAVRVLDRARLTPELLRRLGAPHPEVGWLREVFASSVDVAISAEVARLLDPRQLGAPAHGKGQHSKGHGLRSDAASKAGRLKRYIGAPAVKKGDRSRAGKLHDFMLALLNADTPKMMGSFRADEASAFWGPEKPKGDAPHLIETPAFLEARFESADMAAKSAAGWHRDATWWIYGSAALAVFSAVAGAIHLWPGQHGIFWPVVELFSIALIVALFLKAKDRKWHEQWIGQRFIAEQVRYALMCLPALTAPNLFYAPAWRSTVAGLELESPELWFIQRTLHCQGLPRASADGPFVACRPDVMAQVKAYVTDVLKDQSKYHKRTAKKLHVAHRRLHHFSIGLFVVTALAVPAHFLLHAKWLLMFTAFFPALAAAIHGLSTKLEIARLAWQHEETADKLDEIATAVRALDTTGESGWSVWLRLRELARVAAAAMSEENDQWNELIGHQDTELPA
jgi:hypothetical protein